VPKHLMADCTHPVQMHGLCAICGLDLVDNEYVKIFDCFFLIFIFKNFF
jgi:hypothetical protein